MTRGDSLHRGLAANYLGKAFCAALSLLTLPILFQQMGGEAFGLFGLFFSVQALLGVFDFGVGAAMQRDLAAMQSAAKPVAAPEVLSTLRSVECLLVAVCGLALGAAFALSAYFASNWLETAVLPIELVARTLLAMMVCAALQFIGNFYIGCLNGLRLHARTNTIQSSVWLLRFGGVLICVLPGVAPAGSMGSAVLPVMLVWAASNAVLLVWAKSVLARALQPWANGSGAPVKPSFFSLRRAAGFGLPLVATTTLFMLFNQTDKLAASRLVSLENLGRYTIVWSIAEVMYLMYQPIYTSFLPLFAGRYALAANGSAELLGQSLALAWKLMSVAVLPVAAVVFTLPEAIVFAWTGDAELARGSASILRWVIVGAACNAFVFIPFALQQALGDMRPWMWRVGLAVVVYVPFSVAAIHNYQMLGAAAAWACGSMVLVLCLGASTFAALCVRFDFASLLRQLLSGSAKTLFVCGAVACAWLLLPAPAGRFASALFVLCSLALCQLAALRSQAAVWQLAVTGVRAALAARVQR